MKTILFTTDFSEASENAARYLMGLAQQVPVSHIVLLHSYASTGPDIIYLSDFTEPVIVEKEEVHSDSLQRLKSFRSYLLNINKSDIPVSTISDERSLAAGIPPIIKEYNIDMVVSGLDPSGRTNGESAGSKTLKIALELDVPVLLVPAGVTYQPVNTVLLACDLKKVDNSIPRRTLTELLKELNARLLVVNIEPEDSHESEENTRGQSELQSALESTGAEFYFLEYKDVINGIIGFAEEKKVQMIISIPKKHGIISRILHPAVSKKLAAASPLPIMLLHN